MEWIKSFFGDLGITDFMRPTVGIFDLLDILIVAYIIYKIVFWIKETRAWALFKGILVIFVFAAVAGCPEYAFNEYLQLAIAFGAGGLLSFLIIILAGIYFSSKSRLNGVAGSWIAFAIVCMASYPLQFAEFRWFIVALCVMTVIGFKEWSRNYGSLGMASVKGILCMSIVFAGWLLTRDMTRTNDKSRDYFDVGQSLRRIGKFDEANKEFIEGMSYSSDPMFLNMLGRNMQDMGRYEKAEKYYLRSIDRLPSRLYPRYLLAKLYASPAYFSPDKFRRLYEETNKLEIKVSSPAVSDMQKELRQLNDSMLKQEALIKETNLH